MYSRLLVESLEKRICLAVNSFLSRMGNADLDLLASTIVDMDLDGDNDVVVETGRYAERRIFWLENTDGRGDLSVKHHVADPFVATAGILEIVADDIDGDGDFDLLASNRSYYEGARYGGVSWLENIEGDFSDPRPVIDRVYNHIATGDLNGNGLPEIVGSLPSRVDVWSRDGLGEYARSDTLHTRETVGGGPIQTVDIEGDGDVDVIQSGRDGVLLFRATPFGFRLSTVFGEPAGPAQLLRPLDLNDDGLIDIVYSNSESVRFLEQRPDETFSIDEFSFGVTDVGDVDGDLDLDFIGGSVWLENDGKQFVQRDLPEMGPDIFDITVGDLNGDGAADIFSSGPQAIWITLQCPGDSNQDGVFDSSDLVSIFQQGEYEDGIRWNSTFEEGDWNGDGEFDSSDLVFAFANNVYSTLPLQQAHHRRREATRRHDWLVVDVASAIHDESQHRAFQA